MADSNKSSLPLVAAGGKPPYVFSVVLDADTTIPAIVETLLGSPHLTVDATTKTPGSYQVKVQIQDANSDVVTELIPVQVLDNKVYVVKESLYNFSIDQFPYTTSLQLSQFGATTGALIWELQTGSHPGATIDSTGKVTLTFTQYGTTALYVKLTDSAARFVTKTITLNAEATSKPYRLVDGQVEIDLKPLSDTGPRSFAVEVEDSLGTRASRQFNFLANPPISGVKIKAYTFDRYFSRLDAGSYSIPITGSLENTTVSPVSLPPVLGMSASVNSSSKTLVVSGPPREFGNDELHAMFELKRDQDSVGFVSRPMSLCAFDGSDLGNLGSNRITTRPYIVGETVTLNHLKPWFNSLNIARNSGWKVRVQTGSLLPPGLSLDQNTGLIYGVLSGSFSRKSELEFYDSMGAVKGGFEITWDVLNSEFVVFESLPASNLGKIYTGTLTTQSQSPLTQASVYSGTLPTGLSLQIDPVDPAKVNLVGTPSVAGYFDVWFKFVNQTGQIGYSYKRFECFYSDPIVITTSVLPRCTTNLPYSFQLSAYGGVLPYTWTLDAASPTLPAGITLSPTGVLSGTCALPSYLQGLIFKVTDSLGSSTVKTLPFQVGNQLAIITPVLPYAQTGLPYAVTLEAVGGTPDINGQYDWTLDVASPALPSGLSIALKTGVLSGTTSVTTYDQSIIVRVTDSVLNTTTKQYRLFVDSSGAPTLTVSTSGLPNVARGCAYQGILSASGSTKTPFTWTLISGSLPAGLTLQSNGHIVGSTIASFTTTFRVRVVDSVGAFGERDVTLTSVKSLNMDAHSSIINLVLGRNIPVGDIEEGFVAGYVTCNPPLSLVSIAPSIPGLNFVVDGTRLLLNGTPSVAGHYAVVSTVRDVAGDTVTLTTNITVNNSTLLWVTNSLPNASVGTSYKADLLLTGGTPMESHGCLLEAFPWWPSVSDKSHYHVTLAPSSVDTLEGVLEITYEASGSGIKAVLSGTIPSSWAGRTLDYTFRGTDSTGAYVNQRMTLAVPSNITFQGISGNIIAHVTGAQADTPSRIYGMPGLSGSPYDLAQNECGSFRVRIVGLDPALSPSAYTVTCTNYPKIKVNPSPITIVGGHDFYLQIPQDDIGLGSQGALALWPLPSLTLNLQVSRGGSNLGGGSLQIRTYTRPTEYLRTGSGTTVESGLDRWAPYEF